MIIVDTTVLIYAVGAEHPLRLPCRRIISAIGEGAIAATTTVEVIQEFAHVRARRYDRKVARTDALTYMDLLTPLLGSTADDLRRGLDIFADNPTALGCFDAILTAAAQAAGATAIVSADRAFHKAADFTCIFPDEAGVTGLLSMGEE